MKRIILLMLLAAVFLTACKNEGKTDQGVRVSPAPKGTEAEKPGTQDPEKPGTKDSDKPGTQTEKDPENPGDQTEKIPTENDTLTGVILPGIIDDSVVSEIWKGGKKVAEVTDMRAASITNAGILYAKYMEKGDFIRDSEYHIMNPDTGEDKLLGVVVDESYETNYNRVELGGKIYTLIRKGELTDEESFPLILLEIDPEKGLTERDVCPDGFPYAMLSRAGDKLLIGNHDLNEAATDSVWLYDPKDESFRQVICYQEESRPLLQVYHDGKNAYILCLREVNGSSRIIVEQYDESYRKIAETVITDLYLEGVEEGLTKEDVLNEMIQPVARFFLTEDGHLYYENFSCTSFLADLKNGCINQSGECFRAAKGSDALYYDLMKGFREGTKVPNRMYRLDRGDLKLSESNEENPLYYYTDISVSENGTVMSVFEYDDPENIQPDLPPRLVIQ